MCPKPGKVHVKPRPPQKPRKRRIVYPSWPVGEKRMVSFPVGIPYKRPRFIHHLESRSGKSVFFQVVRRKSAKKWVIALVERQGPKKFILLKKAIGTYSEDNPGERVLKILAKEFGLSWPAKLAVIRPLDTKLFAKQLEEA